MARGDFGVVQGGRRSRVGFVGDSKLMYAARVADQRRKSEAEELIRARVSVWRAQAWTSWLPAMVVLPGVFAGGSTIVDAVHASLRGGCVITYRPIDVAILTAITPVPYGLLWLIGYGLRRLAPRMRGRQMPLAFADLVGRGVTLILVILVGLWIGGGLLFVVGTLAFGDHDQHAGRMEPEEALDMLGALSGVAGGLILTGWVGIRRRDALRCARCDYPIGSVRRGGEVCPECGNAWKRVGGLRRWRRISIWWLVGAVGLIVLAGAMQFVAR